MSSWAETYEQAREIGKRVRRQRNKYSFAGHLQRWLSAGVGTAKQLAAVQMGRKFIGIEREPKCFDIACRRIEEAYMQPRLFDDAPKVKPQNGKLEL